MALYRVVYLATHQIRDHPLDPIIDQGVHVVGVLGDLIANIEQDGMLHIGRLGNVEFFEYTGEFNPDGGGTAEPFIRDEYVEFFSTSQRSISERQLMFGMIPDLKAIMANLHVTERYFTSKLPDEDAGSYIGYVKSRPFPWLYRADWQVSMKVTA